MVKDQLIHKLSELGTVSKAPVLWREQTRARLLKTIEAGVGVPFTAQERLVYGLQKLRLMFASLRLVPVVVVVVLMLLIGYSPFSAALAKSLPGSPWYQVKRAVEKLELSVRSSSDSQGLFYLTLAGRRLWEAQAVTAAATQAELLRDYNITLGFAQAALEAGLASKDLAKAYDQATDVLAANLAGLSYTSGNRPVYMAAVDMTNKVSARALALLVSSHASEKNGVEPVEVASRLTAEIAKVEAKLEGVEVKIREFPVSSAAPKVVIESKAAVVPVTEASKQAKDNLNEAKELIAKNEFGLALQKVQESEDLTAKSEAAVTPEAEAVTKEKVTGQEGPEQAVPTEGEVKGESTGEVVPEPVLESGGANSAPAVLEQDGAGEAGLPSVQIEGSVQSNP